MMNEKFSATMGGGAVVQRLLLVGISLGLLVDGLSEMPEDELGWLKFGAKAFILGASVWMNPSGLTVRKADNLIK
jgi:hypothetical protein